MVAENFQPSAKIVRVYEGGYSDHPLDPGGATHLGITIAVLSKHRGRPVSKADVRALTWEEAATIYRANYWRPMRCDELPAGLDLAVYDCAVNQGVGRATRFLQQAAGARVDGVMGPVTVAAVSMADPATLLDEFMALRMHGYGMLQKLFRTFGLGWSRRLIGIHSFSRMLVIGTSVAKRAA